MREQKHDSLDYHSSIALGGGYEFLSGDMRAVAERPAMTEMCLYYGR